MQIVGAVFLGAMALVAAVVAYEAVLKYSRAVALVWLIGAMLLMSSAIYVASNS